MTDKRDAVIEAVREWKDSANTPGGVVRYQAIKTKLLCAIAALDSPLPSDEDTWDAYRRGYKRACPGIVIAADSPGFRSARNAVHASALHLAAAECHRRGGSSVASVTAYLNELADEMDSR